MRESNLRSSLQELNLLMPLTAQACDLLVATGKRRRLLATGFEPECHGLHRAPYQLGHYKHTSRRLRRLLGFEITKKSTGG